MKITILCVGKLKEDFYRDFISEYSKRLSKYADLSIIEIPDLKIPKNASEKDEEIVLLKEGRELINKIVKKSGVMVITLEIEGKAMTSVDFADFLKKNAVEGINHFVFVIGGSLGLHKEVCKLSDFRLSFSKMTFTHQFARMMILEQVYRGFRINGGEPYHK